MLSSTTLAPHSPNSYFGHSTLFIPINFLLKTLVLAFPSNLHTCFPPWFCILVPQSADLNLNVIPSLRLFLTPNPKEVGTPISLYCMTLFPSFTEFTITWNIFNLLSTLFYYYYNVSWRRTEFLSAILTPVSQHLEQCLAHSWPHN